MPVRSLTREAVMQIAVWAGLGIVAGLIARFSIPRAEPPPPLIYVPTRDDSLGAFVSPASDHGGLLIPVLLGMGAAVGGGTLGAVVDFGRLLDMGSIGGLSAANGILAAGAAILVLWGYRVAAATTGAPPAIGDHPSSNNSFRLSAVRSKSRTAEHAVRSLTGELAVVQDHHAIDAQDHHAIDDDVFLAGREFVRLRRRGVVGQLHVVEP